jgi:peptidoglycan L-alanyl-D-glutamate endopeptidase CwlK
MDQLTIKRIELAHPKIREELKAHYIECNNLLPKGVRLRFAYTYRSPEEQTALFNQRPKVTNAKAWQSIHQYGLAFDYVILLDRDNNGTFESVLWDIKSPHHQKVINYFKSKDYEWGGDWKKFKDYPHFQKTFGYTWQQLKKKVDSGDIIRVDNIVYPKI